MLPLPQPQGRRAHCPLGPCSLHRRDVLIHHRVRAFDERFPQRVRAVRASLAARFDGHASARAEGLSGALFSPPSLCISMSRIARRLQRCALPVRVVSAGITCCLVYIAQHGSRGGQGRRRDGRVCDAAAVFAIRDRGPRIVDATRSGKKCDL